MSIFSSGPHLPTLATPSQNKPDCSRKLSKKATSRLDFKFREIPSNLFYISEKLIELDETAAHVNTASSPQTQRTSLCLDMTNSTCLQAIDSKP